MLLNSCWAPPERMYESRWEIPKGHWEASGQTSKYQPSAKRRGGSIAQWLSAKLWQFQLIFLWNALFLFKLFKNLRHTEKFENSQRLLSLLCSITLTFSQTQTGGTVPLNLIFHFFLLDYDTHMHKQKLSKKIWGQIFIIWSQFTS